VTAGQSFLQELREFLAFLRSLWGLLAGISVLFPLSNVLLSVIPIEGGGNPFQNLSPDVVTALTMLTCIFLTFAAFGRRQRFANAARRASTPGRPGSVSRLRLERSPSIFLLPTGSIASSSPRTRIPRRASPSTTGSSPRSTSQPSP
jgi:hypothetical protein